MNTELLKSKLLEAAFNGSLTHADTSKWEETTLEHAMINLDSKRVPLSVAERKNLSKKFDYYGASGVIDKVDNYIFDKPLLLIGEDGANLLSRSTPIAFIATGKYWVNNHAHVLDVAEGVSLEYVCLYLNSISLVPYVTGVAQPKLNQANLNKIPIPLPPISEQERIVAALEEGFTYIDAVASAKQNLSDTAEMLRNKILQAAFDGSLTHADTSTWEDFALGEIFLMKAGKNVTAADISEEQNEKCPYPCYGGNGLRGYVKDYNTEGIFPIIGRQGALCGNVKYVEGKFFATEHAVVVRNKKEVDSRWAFHALTFLNLNQYATATAQPGLAVSKIEQVRLSLPPLAEQQRIVAKIEELFTQIDKITK